MVLALFLALGCTPGPERVLLVSIDTLRADHIAAYGADPAHTPTLDGVAASGVRFDVAISPAPLTLPSHSTLMTGLDPPEHGVRHNGVFRLPDAIPTLAEQLGGAGFETAAFVGAFVLARPFGLARGFQHYDDRTTGGRNSSRGIVGYAERPAGAVVAAAQAWLESAPDRFFLWVHFYDPHADYQAPPGFDAAVPGSAYAGEIAYTDAKLGRLLAFVRERWSDGRTLIVITSDHGESLGEHGESTHANSLYDATQRIPLLMSGPGLPQGEVVGELVALKDVAPTILELVGLPPLPGASGRSLLPLIRGAENEPRVAYVETLAPQFEWNWSPLLGLRTSRHKYIRAPRPELYDLARDPGEIHNLAETEAALVSELDARLETFLAGSGPVAPNIALGSEERELLESLGYVMDRSEGARPLGVVGGPDPKDKMGVLSAIKQADTLLAEGRPAEALATLREIGEHDSRIYQNLLSGAALATGDLKLAEQAARRTIAAAPSRLAGYGRLAAALSAQGRREEARAVYEEMQSVDPASPVPLTALGQLAESTGEPDRAAEFLRRALAKSSDGAGSAVWRLAAIEIEQGRRAEAEALLAGVDSESLTAPPAALRLSRAEVRAGHPEKALARLAEAVAAHPRDLSLRTLYAARLAEGGQTAEARALDEASLALVASGLQVAEASQRGSYLYFRAAALDGLGRTHEARESLREALPALGRLPDELQPHARSLAKRLGLAFPDPATPRAPGADRS
jgi:arylsulfatase A-like enzyme/predicted Zn-dependent protease